ncbi:sugar kinase [Coprinopsis sp. MPI-PUGE-AT-0042]|nr:sugar kinase [Coprinopsis sp. MPI-PUGE-AT-0042]
MLTGSECKCAVRGSINNDEYFYVDQIARPGETKASKRYASRIGGKGANQAVSIARAGGAARFYGTIGKDGVWIKEQLQAQGIDVSEILISEDPTGRALIQVSDDGENSIILFAGANHSRLHEQKNISEAQSRFGDATHLLLQNEIHWQSTLDALHEGRSRGLVTIFNPSPMPPLEDLLHFPWDKIDWLLVNEGESEHLLQILGSSTDSRLSRPDLLLSLSKLPQFANINIVCTLGSEGLIALLPELHRRTSGFIELPAAKLEGTFRDTTGAGDCFTGGTFNVRIGYDIQEEDVVKMLKKCNLVSASHFKNLHC